MAVTKERVWEAADRLSAEGRKPTLAAVREAVGGSYSTLSPLLQQWREREAAQEQKGTAMPPALSERAAATARALWSTAVRLADERLASQRADMERQLERAEAQRAEAVQLADSVTEELEGAQAELAAAREETRRTRAALAQAREQAARLGGELANQKEAMARLLASLAPAAPPAA